MVNPQSADLRCQTADFITCQQLAHTDRLELPGVLIVFPHISPLIRHISIDFGFFILMSVVDSPILIVLHLQYFFKCRDPICLRLVRLPDFVHLVLYLLYTVFFLIDEFTYICFNHLTPFLQILEINFGQFCPLG